MKNKLKTFLYFCIFVFSFFWCPEVFAAGVDFVLGEYVSSDGKHTIDIASDNTALYDDTYSLKVNDKANGDTITGKIGTDNKSVTFYQLNDSKFLSKASITYKHDDKSVTLNEYQVFSLDKEPVIDATGKFELWRENVKLNSYVDLQSAVDASKNGDIIKITENIDILGGIYVSNKNIIIDGGNNTINSSAWLNMLFFIETDATLTVKNLTIEGGATGFKVDKSSINIQTGTSTKIPLKSGSDTGDIKKNFSVVVTKGKFITENSNYNNNYINGDGAVVNVLSGELIIENSSFNHNRATGKAGVLNLGRKFYSSETDYPVKNVEINNSNFTNSYSNNGGVIASLNVEKIDINGSTFKDNTVNAGKGGVILISREGVSSYYGMHEKLGLSLPKINIDNSLFEGNWVGNDGAAIEDQDAVLKVTNSTFKENVGIHSTSSVGTLSFSMDGGYVRTMVIENCIFDNNLGAGTVVGDHASSNLRIDLTNCKFLSNKSSYNAFLIYTSDVNFKDCVFENEHVSRGIVDIVGVYNVAVGYHPNTITFENTTFNNTEYGGTDILIRKYNDTDVINTATVIIKDNVKAKIDLWQQNKLKIDGNYTGVVNVAKGTPKANVEITDNAVINGEVNYVPEKYLVTLIFKGLEEKEGYNWEARRYIYSDEKTFTEEEFFLEHKVTEDNYKLVYYTDSAFTSPWDYTVSDNISVYARFEEHTHLYDSYTLYENSIYKQCTCGRLSDKLYLEVPIDLVENDLEKPVVVNNNLGLTDSDYVITYQVMNEDGKWITYEGIPVTAGKYKATLTYNNMSIDTEYTISEREVVDDSTEEDDSTGNDKTTNEGDSDITIDEEDKDIMDDFNKDNPITSDGIINILIIFIVGVCGVVSLIFLRRKGIFSK